VLSFHKLVVADMRSGLENPKKDKNTAQAGNLAAILHEEDPDSLAEAANAMTSTMVKRAKKTFPNWKSHWQDSTRPHLIGCNASCLGRLDTVEVNGKPVIPHLIRNRAY